MKIGDKVKFTYPTYPRSTGIGIVKSKKRFNKRIIYIVQTLRDGRIASIGGSSKVENTEN